MPEGLVPGDNYRIAFVTSRYPDSPTLGVSGDISTYNTFVTNTAVSGTVTSRLDTSWTAIASTVGGEVDGPTDARDNTMTNPDVYGPGVPIYLPDGLTRIANDYRDLWDGSIANPIELDEHSNLVGMEVKTGTEPDGTASPGYALGPTSGGPFGPLSTVGSSRSDQNWIASHVRPFAQSGRMYGISGVVSVVPEPSSTVLVGLALLHLAACRRKVGSPCVAR